VETRGKSPGGRKRRGPCPMEQVRWGKAWVLKPQGIKVEVGIEGRLRCGGGGGFPRSSLHCSVELCADKPKQHLSWPNERVKCTHVLCLLFSELGCKPPVAPANTAHSGNQNATCSHRNGMWLYCGPSGFKTNLLELPQNSSPVVNYKAPNSYK
jgi:hypothetical protein